MANLVDPHIEEYLLEEYSLGRLSARNAARVEEHLLVCAVCRDRLETDDAYVAAMRGAAAEIDPCPPNGSTRGAHAAVRS